MADSEDTAAILESSKQPLHDLFDDDQAEDDPFAQLDNVQHSSTSHPAPEQYNAPAAAPVLPPDDPVEDLAATDRDFSDLLAEFEAEQPAGNDYSGHPTEAAVADHGLQHDAKFEDGLNHHVSAEQPEYSGRVVAEDLDESETQRLSTHDERPVLPEPPSNGPVPAPIDAPAGLFDDSPNENTFDILVAPSMEEEDVSQILDTPEKSGANGIGAADQSMQSSLADDSDWLADTSLDDSFAPGKNDNGPVTPPKSSKALPRQPVRQQTENGDEPISFEVPQGWFDDAGNWNWYTDEQREQVRLAMTGEAGWDQEGPEADHGYPEPSPGLPRTPGPQGLSENAARRTPMKETNPYERTLATDPYAPSQPPTASTTGSYDSYQSGSRSSLGETSPYAPAYNPTGQYAPPLNQQSAYAPPTQTSYAPAQPSNPYAPPAQPYVPAQSYAAPQPYGVQQPYTAPQPYGSQQTYTPNNNVIPPFGPPAGPSNISKPPPVAPQRIPSTAYDPPMLKTKKVIRSASTMSIPSGFNTPPTPSQAIFASPPAAPSAPPAGPPRRAKTPKAEPPLAPSNLPPIPDAQMTQTFSPSAQTERSPVDPYASGRESMPPPPVPPSADPYAAGQGSMPPPPPPGPPQRPASSQSRVPRTPSYAAFDPPLRPASTSRQRDPSRPPIPAFAPPPVASPPRMLSPSQTMPPPPRPTSSQGMTMPPPRAVTPRATSSQGVMMPPPPGQTPQSASSQGMMMPPPRAATPQSTSSQGMMMPPLHAQTPQSLTADALSPPHPAYEPPRTASRASQRKSPMFETKPTYDSRPPSRINGQQVSQMPRDESNPEYIPPARAEPDSYQPPAAQMEPGPYQLPAAHAEPDPYERPPVHPEPDPYQPYPAQPQSASPSDGPNGAYQDSLGLHVRDRHLTNDLSSPYDQRLEVSDIQGASSYAPPPIKMGPSASLNLVNGDGPHQQANEYRPVDNYASRPDRSGYQAQTQTTYDPYAPSPSTSSSYTPQGVERQSHSRDPYAPSYQPYDTQAYAPSTSQSQDNNQAYAPSSYEPYSNDQTYAPAAVPGRGTSPPTHQSFPSISSVQDHTYTPQQVLEQRPVSEDPLGRATLAARNAPIAVFGFGGRLITAFPGLAEDNAVEENDDGRTPAYGYASGRGKLWIRSIDETSSSSALRTSDTPFPGPLVFDPSAAKGATGDKKKREAVLAFLEARAKEIEQGLPYLKTSASQSRREEEGKLALVRLLSAMVIGNGKLSGSPEIEEAVRIALNGSAEPSAQPGPNNAANPLSPVKNAGAQSYFSGQSTQSSKATPTQLAQLSTYLKRGERAEAVQFATSLGLWAHALLISSSVDAERWKEVVVGFLQAELGANIVGNAAMRTSYTLFAGLTPASVDDVVNIANITHDAAADQWQQVLSAIVFNGKPADLVCIDDLAAKLNASGLVNAAHACHLLSPTSPFSDTTPAVFDRLIGLTQNPRDDDALVFAEVAEYARSLIAVPKGQEPTIPALPQLLPYKLQRAWRLAELGDVEQAQRYCTAIESASRPTKNAPSRLPYALIASLEDLVERLTGTPSASPANLLMPNKNKKTGVDKFGSWIEGRLTKFIAGEEDATPGTQFKVSPAKAKLDPKDAKGSIGPFSHFSTISPAASGTVTRAASAIDFPTMNGQLQDPSGTSPALLQDPWGQPLEPSLHDSQSSSSTYGAYEPHGGLDASPWSDYAPKVPSETAMDEAAGGLVNPMAYMNLGPSPEAARVNYTPQPVNLNEGGDDDDDLGFGNSSLSRTRTPKPTDGSQDSKNASPNKSGSAVEETPKQEPRTLGKADQKGSWIGRWWGKKEGEGSGPVRAKLGEESSMIFDPDLKRWVVKGQKPDAAPPPLAPPPRAQTVSPAITGDHPSGTARSSSVAPLSNLGMSAPPSGMPPPAKTLPRSTTAPIGFTQLADGSVKRAKPPHESLTGDGPPPMPSAPASNNSSTRSSPSLGPPPPGLPRSATAGASLDDLLSRPPSKRPASGARKPMKSRYVDVFQPGQQ